MDKYKKKRNYIQALLEFKPVQYVLITITVIIGIIMITYSGHLFLLKYPSLKQPLEININTPWISYRSCEFLVGILIGIPVCIIVFLIALIVKGIMHIPSGIKIIRTNLHAAKIIQYLPLTEIDWKAWDVKTNKEAIQTLRDLVHGFGYTDNFCDCWILRDKIWASYQYFLNFVYGRKWSEKDWDGKQWNELHHIEDIVLCSNEDFEQTLKRS